MPFNPDKLAKLVGKGPTTVRTGGKGSVRRKHKVVRKTATHDDKRLKATLNKLSVRDIPAIEEVNLFKDDGTVIHFVNPKVRAQHRQHTYIHSTLRAVGQCGLQLYADATQQHAFATGWRCPRLLAIYAYGS